MTIRVPTSGEVARIADSSGIEISDADADSYVGLIKANPAFDLRVDEWPDPKPWVGYTRCL